MRIDLDRAVLPRGVNVPTAVLAGPGQVLGWPERVSRQTAPMAKETQGRALPWY